MDWEGLSLKISTIIRKFMSHNEQCFDQELARRLERVRDTILASIGLATKIGGPTLTTIQDEAEVSGQKDDIHGSCSPMAPPKWKRTGRDLLYDLLHERGVKVEGPWQRYKTLKRSAKVLES